ncbi:hypothetical protein FO519_009767 [Halicephalobus sp. NKZ332]|nr:hypothetical protein FO519_009767 [Halicephalobus sp. NKZ332]
MADLSDPSSVFGDLAGEIGRNVYVPDPVEGYKLGELVDFHIDRLKIKLIQNNGDVEDIVYVPHDDVLPAEDDITKDVDDSCSLMYLNEGTLLDNCRLRYARKQIYTYVANILISINPYEVIPGLYSNENINLYHGKSIGTLPPHIFAIADKAHRELKGNKNSQSIIVSGESGGGKTESQKHILRYLCDRWGAAAGSIEQRLLDANPILEAFGNAKTIRNNNSSRFGKFVEIHFNKEYNVSGGFVSHYLLEKSRICHQNPGERNYHIFYQLIAGVDDELAENLYLKSPEEFNYLSQNPKFFANSGTFSKIPIHRRLQQNYLTDDLIDDYINFKTLQKNLEEVGIDEVIQRNIFSIISGILHLGNVNFEDSDDFRGGCCIDSNSSEYLKISARLFGLDIEDFRRQLTSKVIQSKTNSKGTVIIVPLKPSEARAARDAFAKAIYTRLFDDIVAAINNSIPSTDSQFFNERILKNEQELYRCEALNVPEVEFVDNQDCIELFESRGVGLLDLLDEEAKIPRGSSVHFTEEVHRHHISNFRILPPRRSRLRGYRNMRDNEGFLIRHYAGAVCYRTFHFLEKNNDTLHVNLEMIITTSDNPYLKNLFFPTTVNMSSKIPRSNIRTKVHNSIASKFRSQLNSLLSKLKMTGTHFVRCIKPNSEMKPGKFEGAQILSQLKSSGMTSVLKLMHCGFPSRISFKELYTSYQFFLPENLKKLDPRFFGRFRSH